MAVLSTRTNGRIDFTFFVVQDFGPEGTEFAYDISDDGWKIWIRASNGNLIDSIKCDDDRLADANTAAVLLHDWATAKWGNAAVNKRTPTHGTQCSHGRSPANCNYCNPPE